MTKDLLLERATICIVVGSPVEMSLDRDLAWRAFLLKDKLLEEDPSAVELWDCEEDALGRVGGDVCDRS